ncbi:hypothetical protein [Archangium lipolyticum]|uniref:hypothetical protein n=1 Tax=Archangium lipolyticum TaxID=2970465 RepID=UPI002149A203|nr:hypothetical protein [Archangium lipolyticum]
MKDIHSLLEDWRDAIRRDDSWLRRQEPLHQLLESLPPAIALEVARRCLLDFVPYFERNTSGVTWVREFLSQPTLFGQAKPKKPANFAEEEDRYAFPGAGNFINAIEEFWIALGDVSLQLIAEQVAAALSSVVMAEFIVRQASKDPLRWLVREKMAMRAFAAREKGERDQDSHEWLSRDYSMQRKDPWWHVQMAELWLRVADLIEEAVSVWI